MASEFFFASRSTNPPTEPFWALPDKNEAANYATMLTGTVNALWEVIPKANARALRLADLKDKKSRAIFDKINARRLKNGEAEIPENRWARMATLDLLEREDWVVDDLKRICDYAIVTDHSRGKHEALFIVNPKVVSLSVSVRKAGRDLIKDHIAMNHATKVSLVRQLVRAARMLIVGREVTMDWNDFGERELLDAGIEARLFVDTPDRPSQGSNPAMAIEINKDDITRIDDDPELEQELLVAARDELGFAVEWSDPEWFPQGKNLARQVQPASKDTTFRYLLA